MYRVAGVVALICVAGFLVLRFGANDPALSGLDSTSKAPLSAAAARVHAHPCDLLTRHDATAVLRVRAGAGELFDPPPNAECMWLGGSRNIDVQPIDREGFDWTRKAKLEDTIITPLQGLGADAYLIGTGAPRETPILSVCKGDACVNIEIEDDDYYSNYPIIPAEKQAARLVLRHL